MDKLSSQVRKMCKLGWMDSIAFHHELPYKPVNEVYSSKSVCRMKHPCIENCERCSDEPYPCHAMRVYVVDADALETLLPEIEELEQDAVSVITEAQMTHVKTWPDLGDCEWNCRTMEPLVALLEKVREREDALIKDALYIGQCVPQRIALNYDVLIKKVRERLARKEQVK